MDIIDIIQNGIFKIQSKIYRHIAKIFLYRPTSYPYITGDGFRSMANHVYDEVKKCDASDIKDGEIVFLKADKIQEWFEQIHPKINVPYKLITHNSDAVVGENEIKFIDNKIIRWFAQNNIVKHEKITPIPIGIENKKIFVNGWALLKVISKLSKSPEKENKILVGFNLQTNSKERTAALNSLQKSPVADIIKSRMSPLKYMEILNQYKYVASPEGNGPDCIRTWEAIICRTIPIIKNTSNNQLLLDPSLPILMIENWKEVESLDENRLYDIYKNYDPEFKSDITKFDYWKK